MPFFFKILFVFLFFICNNIVAFASLDETYGLIFNIGDNNNEGQTSFDLTSGRELDVENRMSLSFRVSTVSHRTRFGYIARVIINDKHTLNFVLNNTSPQKTTISLVNDGRLLRDEPLRNSRKQAFDWNDIGLELLPNEKTIKVKINGEETTHSINWGEELKARVLFGANDVEGFVVRDVPTIIIRDLSFDYDGKSHLWRMKNHRNNSVIDEISNKKLDINNPKWESELHSSWQLEYELVSKSRIFPVFNDVNVIHCVTADAVMEYNVETGRTNKLSYNQPMELMNTNNQFVYDFSRRQIRYFDVVQNRPFVSYFNRREKKWLPEIKLKNEAHYHKSNLFVSPVDSMLIQMFGYGHFKYYSTLFKSRGRHFEQTTLDNIAPRYLASVAVQGEVCYVYGGVGNDSGRQELGARNFYDLHKIDFINQQVSKVWEMPNASSQEVAIKNMLILPDNPNYGVSLFYKPLEKQTNLYLKAINLKEPKVDELLSTPIPYNFIDVESEAQLIYVKSLSKLFAVIVERQDDGMYKMKVYSIAYPVVDVASISHTENSSMVWIVIQVLLVLVIIFAIVYVRRKRRQGRESAMEQRLQHHIDVVIEQEREINIVPQTRRAGIYLLDGFTVFDKDSQNITNEFTPLMKQLLCLIILYTQKNGKGVSNTVLKDTLWFDKSDSSARNNRGVTISKIRQSLQKVGGFQIIFNNSYWHIEYGEGDYCDYAISSQMISNIGTLDLEQQVMQMSEAAQMGELLPNQMFDFFDGFKAEYTSMIIDKVNEMLPLCENLSNKVILANLILKFDKVDETAMRAKCLALIALGKNGVAKTTFDSFIKEYATLFGEEYATTFEDFVKE